jgi:hypothetical protein
LPDQPDPVSCETLDDARRIAYLTSRRRQAVCRLLRYRLLGGGLLNGLLGDGLLSGLLRGRLRNGRLSCWCRGRLPCGWPRGGALLLAPSSRGRRLPVISARWMLSRSWVTDLLTLRGFLHASVSVVSRSLRTSRVPLDYFPGNIS